MPAGPLVEKYSVTLTMEPTVSEYGHPAGRARGTIKWRPEAEDLRQERDLLLGKDRQEIDEYHSQLAVCPTWTVLNQMQKKIERGKTQFDFVQDRAARKSKDWAEAWYAMNQNALDAFSYDQDVVDRYIAEHKVSAVIPPTLSYGSVKWSELNTDQTKHLFEAAKSYLEAKMDNWNDFMMLQWSQEALGMGTRARSPKIDGYVTEFDYVIPQAREIGYNPYISTWYAWMTDDGKKKIYEPMIELTENKYGIEVGFPPLQGGAFWQRLAEYREQGFKLITGDGTTWDLWVTMLINDYSTSSAGGVPGLISGQAMTTPGGTFANHMLSEDHIDMRWVEAIFALGDDKIVILRPDAPDEAVRELPNVWEFDPIATKHTIALGVIVLDDRKGTFSGAYRPTIDRGRDRISLTLGKEKSDIVSTMTDENRETYLEIMGKGTLQGIPFIDRIAGLKGESFWDGWRRSRYEYLGGLAQGFEVLIQDDHFEL